MIERAISDTEILAAYPVLRQLRSKLVESEVVATVRRMEAQGFELIVLRDPIVRAVAGYRELEMLATGRMLYVDDLVTDEQFRSRGYGKQLLDWLVAEARRRKCHSIELLSRPEAEAFYRRHGMVEIGRYFSLATA